MGESVCRAGIHSMMAPFQHCQHVAQVMSALDASDSGPSSSGWMSSSKRIARCPPESAISKLNFKIYNDKKDKGPYPTFGSAAPADAMAIGMTYECRSGRGLAQGAAISVASG